MSAATIRYRSHRRHSTRGCPVLWLVQLRDMGAPDGLIYELWHLLEKHYASTAQAVSYRVGRMVDVLDDPERVHALWMQVASDVTPQLLFGLTMRLSPEGNRRKRAVIAVEEAILARIDADGQWLSTGGSL